MFDRVGQIVYPAKAGSADVVLRRLINAGADDVKSDAEGHVITCAFSDLGEVAKNLEQALGEAETVKAVAAADHRQPRRGEGGDDAEADRRAR